MPHEILQRLLIHQRTSLRLHQRLLEVARLKREHLTVQDVIGLRRDLDEEERLAAAGAQLRMERDVLHQACCAKFGIAPDTELFAALEPHMCDDTAARSAEVRAEMNETMTQLRQANRANAMLVNISSGSMAGLLTAVSGGAA